MKKNFHKLRRNYNITEKYGRNRKIKVDRWDTSKRHKTGDVIDMIKQFAT